MDSDYDIEALQFATGREAFDYCDGPHEGCGGDAVAIQRYADGVVQNLAIARSDARRLHKLGLRLIYLREVALMRGDGTVVCGWESVQPLDPRGAGRGPGAGGP